MAAKRAGGGRVVKIPYSIVIRGNRFFQPKGRMLRLGFRPMALGPDGEASRRLALGLYERWLAVREGRAQPEPDAGAKRSREEACAARVYPRGSVGAAWQEWVRSDEWRRKAPGTRNKIWWEAWTKRIEPAFGDMPPDMITMADISLWRAKVEKASGADTAHKALKVWRAFWRVMTAMRYTQLTDPSAKVVNKAPPPRVHRFHHGEAMRLAKHAWRMGYEGLACIVAVAWDTGFAPVDCRTLCVRHRSEDPGNGRLVFDRTGEGRSKTGVAVVGTTSRFTDWLARRYFARFAADPVGDAPLFRTRTGVRYGESRLGNDFAKVREAAMPGDKRQLRDMRRSGVLEAFAGDAKPENVAAKFGNTIGRSNTLFRTYNPVDLEKVRLADEKRLKGRRKRNAG